MQNADGFSRLPGELRVTAEIRLPLVRNDSSIMPGKVNPIIPMMFRHSPAFKPVANDN